mgnify:CR=1 FL=1
MRIKGDNSLSAWLGVSIGPRRVGMGDWIKRGTGHIKYQWPDKNVCVVFCLQRQTRFYCAFIFNLVHVFALWFYALMMKFLTAWLLYCVVLGYLWSYLFGELWFIIWYSFGVCSWAKPNAITRLLIFRHRCSYSFFWVLGEQNSPWTI